jgi:hypothetical protein
MAEEAEYFDEHVSFAEEDGVDLSFLKAFTEIDKHFGSTLPRPRCL